MTHAAKKTRAWLGLGANQGDRRSCLRAAVLDLAAEPGLRVTAVSGLWESEYVGPGEQDPYLNACVEVETYLAPPVLLGLCKALERAYGRTPDTHLQPRPLDLDVLLYGDLHQSDADPLLPHPRLAARAFVLEPLAQIAPARVLPDSGKTVNAACAKIRREGGSWVRFLPDPAWPPRVADTEEDGRAALELHRR
ncbi:MAG: 2-amino-4-hydroxy-6-hydroxymethyldihydropteridine diphosphokinase [bacterium]|nr:2-amino-4-hydroxy-6-hydroxymethyldihydropteridine diphosphokinase [bacterium]